MAEQPTRIAQFTMPTDSSASFRVAAALVPFADSVEMQWVDQGDGTTRLVVETSALGVEHRVLQAHPKVREA